MSLDVIVWSELKSYSHNDELRPSDCADHAISIAKKYAAEIERFILGEIINGGLQLRKGADKNAMAWWYADGTNAEGADLESLHGEIERRMNTKET